MGMNIWGGFPIFSNNQMLLLSFRLEMVSHIFSFSRDMGRLTMLSRWKS